MVSHIIHCSGDAGDRELQNRIIEVDILHDNRLILMSKVVLFSSQ